VIGERGLKEGQLEFQARTDAEATNVPVAEVLNRVREAIQAKLN
jgi:prolyl-tRNA synthetase